MTQFSCNKCGQMNRSDMDGVIKLYKKGKVRCKCGSNKWVDTTGVDDDKITRNLSDAFDKRREELKKRRTHKITVKTGRKK